MNKFLLLPIIVLFSQPALALNECSKNWARTKQMIEYNKAQMACQQPAVSSMQCQSFAGLGNLNKTQLIVGGLGIGAAATYGIRKLRAPKFCMFSFDLFDWMVPKAHADSCVPKKTYAQKQALALVDNEIAETKKAIRRLELRAKSEAERFKTIRGQLASVGKNFNSPEVQSRMTTILDDIVPDLTPSELDKLDKEFPGLKEKIVEHKKAKPWLYKPRGDRNFTRLSRHDRYYILAQESKENLKTLENIRSGVNQSINENDIAKHLAKLPDNTTARAARKIALSQLTDFDPSMFTKKAFGEVGKRVGKKLALVATSGPAGVTAAFASTLYDVYEIGGLIVKEVQFCERAWNSESPYLDENTACEAIFNEERFLNSTWEVQQEALKDDQVCNLFRKSYQKVYGPGNWKLTCSKPSDSPGGSASFKLVNRSNSKLFIEGEFRDRVYNQEIKDFEDLLLVDSVKMKLDEDKEKPDAFTMRNIANYSDSTLSTVAVHNPSFWGDGKYEGMDFYDIDLQDDEDKFSNAYYIYLSHHLAIQEASACCSDSDGVEKRYCEQYMDKDYGSSSKSKSGAGSVQ